MRLSFKRQRYKRLKIGAFWNLGGRVVTRLSRVDNILIKLDCHC
jgi:hypothetical protein